MFFTDVIAKFNAKLKEIEREVGDVLKLEAEERELIQTENEIKRAEKTMKGKKEEKRSWFQNRAERELSKGQCRSQFIYCLNDVVVCV